MTTVIPGKRWLVAGLLALAAIATLIGVWTTQTARAHAPGGTEPFSTFLDAGFTQELWGTAPGFMGGVAFAPDGDVWVSSCSFSNGSLRRFDSGTTAIVDVGPPDTSAHPLILTVAGATARAGCGLTNHPNGNLYSNTRGDRVVEHDANTGAFIRSIGSRGNALGITTDPTNGRVVYVAENCRFTGTCDIRTVDPVTLNDVVFVSLGSADAQFVDGIYFNPDGSQLFLANRSPAFRATVIDRTGPTSGVLNRHIPLPAEPDGIAFHSASGDVMTLNINSTMSRIALGTPDVVSLFASGGFRGDLSQVGADGCFYGTQNGTRFHDGGTSSANSVVRICGGFVPPPGVEPEDTTPPSCVLAAINADPSPPANTNVDIDIQDTESGLAAINVTSSNNVTVNIPAFTLGETGVVTVHAELIVQGQSGFVLLEIIDVAGNVFDCDPVITLEIRENGKPVSHTFENVPQAESNVTVTNHDPGVKNLEIDVNGKVFSLGGLKDNEVRNLDISSAMVEGDNNTITLTAKGKPGGRVTVLITD